LIASSSNENVIPNNALTISGTGNQQTLTISILSSNSGQTTISIAVIDELGLNVSTSFSILLELCLGNENLNSDLIAVYPNPSTGIFQISGIEDNNSSYDVSVCNLLGANIYNFSNINKNQAINIADAAPGIYLVKVKSNNAISTFKVLKQ
jgi:hypothetical protein